MIKIGSTFHGLQMALLICFHSLLVLNNANAYKTFELVEYCQRFDNNMKFPDENINDDIIKSGLVIPKKYHYSEPENQDHYHYDLDYEEDAGETVTVDTGYDTSAIRLIVDPENVFRARLRCSILVMPKKPNGLIVTLRKLNVRPGTDWLRISINNSSFTRTFSHVRINGEQDSVAYVAHHGVLIEFGTRTYLPKNEPVEIELILTSFREADLCDIDQEFDCGSFRCISNNYLCDGFNNCGDGRDESGCPMDNITNYLIISTTLLLAAFLIFLCFCYRCCFNKRHRHSPYRKQYQYLKIRTNSQMTPYAPKYRSHSIHSEADLPTNNRNNNNNDNNNNNPLRRIKFAQVGDSMPVLLPSAPTTTQENSYGSTGNTYFLPYQPYTISLGNGQGNRIGLIPLGPSTSRQHTAIPEHHTFPLPQPTYPMLHPQLFQPPSHTPPPPPYTPRDPGTNDKQTGDN